MRAYREDFGGNRGLTGGCNQRVHQLHRLLYKDTGCAYLP